MDLPENSASERDQTPSNLIRHVDTETLFAGAKVVVIHHSGEEYRLTVTKNDKLILQK